MEGERSSFCCWAVEVCPSVDCSVGSAMAGCISPKTERVHAVMNAGFMICREVLKRWVGEMFGRLCPAVGAADALTQVFYAF